MQQQRSGADGPAVEGVARCQVGVPLTRLFFSDRLDDIAVAKAICGTCDRQPACLRAAVERREPCGVWGGQLFQNGEILAHKRARGRPRKVAPVLTTGA